MIKCGKEKRSNSKDSQPPYSANRDVVSSALKTLWRRGLITCCDYTVSTYGFRRNSWWQNYLAKIKHYMKSKGWLNELWRWDLHVLNLRKSPSVVVLLNMLAYVSQKNKQKPSQWSLTSALFIAFSSLNCWRPYAWVSGLIEHSPAVRHGFIQGWTVDISISLSKLQQQRKESEVRQSWWSRTLNNPR